MSLEFQTRGLYEDIFSTQVLDDATRDRKVVVVKNDQSRNLTENDQSNLSITADFRAKMVFLREATIEIQLAVNAGVAPIADVQGLGFANFPFFNRSTFLVNDTTIEDITSDSQIASTVMAFAEKTRIYNETVLSNACLSYDPADNRRKLFANITALTESVKFHIPLAAIFRSIEDIPMLYGCTCAFKFSRNDVNKMIASVGAGAVLPTSIYIKDLRLHVPVYVPTDLVKAEIEAKLAAGFDREFYFETTYVRASGIMSSGSISDSFPVSHGVPVRLYAVPLITSRDNPTHAAGQTHDRTQFTFGLRSGASALTMTKLNMNFDNVRVLDQDIEFLNKNDFADLYRAYLDHLRREDSPLGVPLSYEEFVDSFEVVCFDLQHKDPSIYDSGRSFNIEYQFNTSGAWNAVDNLKLYSVVVCRTKMRIRGEKGSIYIVK